MKQNDINKKFDSVSKIVGYAKILISKKDFVQSSLLLCKAFEILSLSDEEEHWLLTNNPLYQQLEEGKKAKKQKVTGDDKISFMLNHYYLNNFDNVFISAIIKKTTKSTNEKTIGKLRNNLIHHHVDFRSPLFIKETQLLLDKLLILPFIKDRLEDRYGSIKNITCNYEAERDFKVDLGIHNKSEVAMTSPSDLITPKSFENLIEAKENIFLVLRDILCEYCDSNMLDTENIQVSTVDSTSAYVWLTIPIKTKGNVLPDNFKARVKLYVPTISILMTPKEFWVYLEFAGFTHRYKLEYYNYLLEGNHLKNLIKNMQKTDLCEELEYYPCLRNVHWFVFETNDLNLSKISSEEIDTVVVNYKNQIKEWLKNKKEDFFKKSEADTLKPISWNIALLGWVYQYENFGKTDITISDFFDRIQKHIETLKPVIRCMRNISDPFNNDRDQLLDRYSQICNFEN
jgi:hypothetical protein